VHIKFAPSKLETLGHCWETLACEQSVDVTGPKWRFSKVYSNVTKLYRIDLSMFSTWINFQFMWHRTKTPQ